MLFNYTASIIIIIAYIIYQNIYIICYNLCRTLSAHIDPIWLIHVVSTALVAPVCIIYTIYNINLYYMYDIYDVIQLYCFYYYHQSHIL